MTAPQDSRVTPPARLYVDALGFVWQDGATPGSLSMARTTERNLASPGLVAYEPTGGTDRIPERDRLAHAMACADFPEAYADELVRDGKTKRWADYLRHADAVIQEMRSDR